MKKVVFTFVAASLMSSAAHAASAVAGAVATMAIVGATLVGTAVVTGRSPVLDVLQKQAIDLRDGSDREPGKELSELFYRIRQNPEFSHASDRQLTEEVLTALAQDPIQN